MDKIICLVGPSGSGKTTIAKELEKEGYNIILSYTDRKPRNQGEWGHVFVSKNTINHVNEWDIIALKELYQGEDEPGDYYWATKEQYQGKGTSIYIVDPDGAEQVKKNVKDAEVVTIFLIADEEVRAGRLKDRAYKSRGIPNYIPIEKLEEFQKNKYEIWEEIENRIEKDRETFSKCKCDYAVDANRSIEKVLADVKEIIGGIE